MEKKKGSRKLTKEEAIEREDDAREIVNAEVVTKDKKETSMAIVDTSPHSLLEKAIENKVDVESLERLVALQERWEAKEAKKAFDKAMASFQAECPTINKTKGVKTKTGEVAYRYAPIESIVNQVKDLLEKHGFSYSTSMELQDKGVKVSVRVVHEQGHSEISEMAVPFGTMTAIMSASQRAAAAQTFAKRYAFCNAFGILTGDEDNDGADLTTNKTAPTHPTSTKTTPPAQPERTIQMDPDAQEHPDEEAHRCQVCANKITPQESVYSIRMYGKPLCRPHQREAKHI